MANAPKPVQHRPQFSPLSIARMLWKHKASAFGLFLLVSVAGAAIVYRLPAIFKAEAVILVDSQKIPEKFVASTVQVTLQDSLTAISQQVLSTLRLHKIVTDFNLYAEERKNQPIEKIIDRMRTDLIVAPEKGWGGGRSAAFRISYECPSAKVSAGVVNEVASLFIGENFKTREQRAENTADFLDNQLQQAKKGLEQQEANLSRFKIQHAGELPQQESALLGALSRLQSELTANQDAISRAEQNKLVLENTLRSAESTVSLLSQSLDLENRPRVTVTEPGSRLSYQADPPSELEKLRARLAAARLRYSDEHPEVKSLTAALQDLFNTKKEEASLPKPPPAAGSIESLKPIPLRATVQNQLIADLNRERERINSTQFQIGLLVKEIDNRTADHRRLVRSIGAYQAGVEKIPIREQEMLSLTRDYESSKENYSSLLSKKMSAMMASEMERGQQSERFTLLESAQVPTAPVKPKRELLYGAVFLFAIAVGLVSSLGFEMKCNYFLGEWELPAEARVIGRISKIQPKPAQTRVKRNQGLELEKSHV